MDVLIVEDDDSFISLFKKVLLKSKYKLKICKDGESALQAFREKKYLLLIIDIGLPKMNGLELCRRIRQEPENEITFILLISSMIAPRHFDLMIDLGIDDYLSKPFHLQEFRIRLQIAENHIRNRIKQKAFKQAAESASRAKDKFLAHMSHELRTPLNGILGYAQILKQDRFLNDSQRQSIEVIHQSGEHLLLLISDLLDLSTIEANQMKIEASDFQLLEFLNMLRDIGQFKAKYKGLDFHYNASPDLPKYVRGDAKRLRQVLLNLLGNAVKFTQSGSLSLRVSKNNEKILFTVKDTGIGIEKSRLKEIFMPFRQISHTNLYTEGTGLGLAISQKLVKMMGGELIAQSEFGKGSSFYFEIVLPETLRKSKAHKKDKKIIGFMGRKRKILIVDDVSMNRTFLEKLLKGLGFEIKQAIDGTDAFEKAEAFLPDLIFMDLFMPGMNGFAATRKFREESKFKDISIIAITAGVSDEIRQKCMISGFTDYIPKPVNLDVITEFLEKHLKLEWIYQDPNKDILDNRNKSESKSESKLKSKLEPESSVFETHLPNDVLQKLLNFAMTGNIMEIEKYAKEIKAMGPELAEFGDQIQKLAKAFKINELKKFLGRYVKRGK